MRKKIDQRILKVCQDYINNNIDESKLQEIIRNIELTLTSLEDSYSRSIASDLEGSIELVLFTIDKQDVRTKLIIILQEKIPELDSQQRS